jgi:hypothetical protein
MARPGPATGTTIGTASRGRGASDTRAIGAVRRARGEVETFSQPAAGHSLGARRWRGRACCGGELMGPEFADNNPGQPTIQDVWPE